MTEQQQRTGSGGTNIQVAGNFVYNAPLTYADMRDIATDVYNSNFIALEKRALETANERAAELREEFITALEHGQVDPNIASDPDMQRALFEAQRDFACSGEEDLQVALVELLVDRAQEPKRTLRALALNEALLAAPKLTDRQRRAVAICFMLRYCGHCGFDLDRETSPLAGMTIESFYEDLVRPLYAPLAPTGFTLSAQDFQHIEYVGAGSLSVGVSSYNAIMARKFHAWFTAGFNRDDAEPELTRHLDNTRFVVPCIRDPDRFQLAATQEADVEGMAEAMGNSHLADHLRTLYRAGTRSQPDIASELEAEVPELVLLRETWDTTELRSLNLTTVGVAIGHGYWRRLTGQDAPLSIWIDD